MGALRGRALAALVLLLLGGPGCSWAYLKRPGESLNAFPVHQGHCSRQALFVPAIDSSIAVFSGGMGLWAVVDSATNHSPNAGAAALSFLAIGSLFAFSAAYGFDCIDHPYRDQPATAPVPGSTPEPSRPQD
jgi:hypothetical protein